MSAAEAADRGTAPFGGASTWHSAHFPARRATPAEPLVLLNSLATTTAIWEPLLDDLTEWSPVLCLDYPGHGRSPARDVPVTMDALVDGVLAVLDRAGIARAHVAGVSIGGMCAVALAARAPDRIASISVIGSGPRLDPRMWADRRRLVEEWGTRGIATDVLRRWFTPDYAAANPVVVAAYREMLLGTSDHAYAALSELLGATDLRPLLDDVRCPALVVCGEHDPAAPVAGGEVFVRGIEDARLEVVPGAAHMVQAMAPEDLAALVVAHMARATVESPDDAPLARP
ncbi:alpha/beta fold hydrolase [Phycicoccus sp. BSK3Z-2]|uniref:Alpha/beta fold hydrolase n=1 Tax=Phycicoccus avicenniae TaxID=2828860 RepID=A0A941D4D8_9MICO|nr:alpha/beta fold hydrolase [Phycicoccus avicenniae]MBR7741685.1 alpha/beta fold hydrolase [Phycicoccus avicenniae]